MKRWLLGCCCALVSVIAVAVPSTEAQRAVEASMLVTGSIVIAPDGSIRSYVVDKPGKLAPAVQALVDKTVAAWKFVPVLVNGQPVTAQTRMHLRLITAPAADGKYAMRVGGASFTGGAPGQSAQPDADAVRHVPPKYPPGALQARVGATVYLLIKIGRDGHVLDAAAEQVNLDTVGTARQMSGLRDAFAKASVAAALLWTYPPPATSVLHDDDSYSLARVPVTFGIVKPGARPEDDYGRWQPYVRGPQEAVPWGEIAHMPADGLDTIPEGSVLMLGQGPQLATPVSGE